MKGYNGWSYRPRRPLGYEVGDPYICRVVPGAHSVRLEWLTEAGKTYTVFFRRRGEGEFRKSGESASGEWELTDLAEGTDYEFYVTAGEGRSRIRLARTGTCPGTAVNYLHPEDEAYVFSGRYLCSPSLVRHPDGFLLASMDVYGPGMPQNLTLIFRSDDEGETWHYVSEITPCFWGKMFIHKGELYMIGCSTEYGDLLIGKSTDGGRTFAAPTVISRGTGGKNGSLGWHKNPQNVVYKNGRLWTSVEWGSWGAPQINYHLSAVLSVGEDEDLLDAENWHVSEPIRYDPTWPGTVQGHSNGTIEGTLTVTPDGKLCNVMRYQTEDAEPCYGRVLAFSVDEEDPDAPLTYSHPVYLNANLSKFMIKRDEVTGKYLTIGSRIDCPERCRDRDLLSLFVSEDCVHFSDVCDLIDDRGREKKSGFQYVDFMIEGEDILFLCRTGVNGQNSYHDSNYQTFHRIENFRRYL